MTARQFKARREKLFLHPTEAAAAMGVTYQALNHWEAGRRPVPKWAVKLLECLEGKSAALRNAGGQQQEPTVLTLNDKRLAGAR